MSDKFMDKYMDKYINLSYFKVKFEVLYIMMELEGNYAIGQVKINMQMDV